MKTAQQKSEAGHVCPHEIGIFLDNPVRRLLNNPKKVAGKYAAKGDTVIDLGCGPGFFTTDLAKMVGESGTVYAVDLQEKMLDMAKAKARKHNVENRIHFHQCGSKSFDLNVKADFILAHYMIHETPDPRSTMIQIKEMLKDNGCLLAVEPRFHISKSLYDSMLKEAEEIGLYAVEQKSSFASWSVVFRKKK